MQNYKHVGRIKTTGRRCLVVFRTLPGDAFNCLIIQTESLEPDYHDQLIKLVESPSAQLANEFSEVLARAIFSDGRTMLPSLHVKGLLSKVPTDIVEMMPNNQTSIILADLNQLIAQQQGVSVQDLAIKPNPAQNEEIQELAMVKEPPAPVQEKQVITATGTPEEQAKFYRSQADKLAKEAANFRRLAEELAPTKKKSTVNT